MAEKLNTFLDRLFQFVPADKQAEARATYSQLSDRVGALEANEARVTDIGRQQQTWWNENKDAVEERNRLRTELAAKGAAAPAMDQNAIEKAIAEGNARTLETGLGLVTGISDIAVAHYAEFGEPLNTRKLAEAAIAAQMPVDQFYAQSVAQRRQERAEADLQKRLAAAKEEGLQAGRKEVLDSIPGKGLPFPAPSAANGPTTLQGLKKPAAGEANPFSLDAAVATAMDVFNKQ